MTVVSWEDFLEDLRLIGGDIIYTCSPRRYGGNITRFRDYGRRITFHFTWSAAEVKRGWSHRRVKKVTLYISNLTAGLQFDDKAYRFGDNIVYLKEHGPLKEADVVPQTSKHNCSSNPPAAKTKKPINNDEPSFL